MGNRTGLLINEVFSTRQEDKLGNDMRLRPKRVLCLTQTSQESMSLVDSGPNTKG